MASLPKAAWVTLVTRASYLPGAVLLAYSIQKHTSKYPLIILTTPSFPEQLVGPLQQECNLTNALHFSILPLSPPPHNLPSKLIASRFEDTWTKLRVFELYKYGCETIVFLDADMLIRANMDEVFEMQLPGKDYIAANHACVCNLDHNSWAPGDWKRENCAYTGLSPESSATKVPSSRVTNATRTHTILNSGMFFFTPYEQLWKDIQVFLAKDARVKTFLFPDQDFLAAFFNDRWRSLSWRYNALKTMRYWHPELWRDEQVSNLHYIVDKPWNKRVGSDGLAGHLGKDGVTHTWWWEECENWCRERRDDNQTEILSAMRMNMA